MAQVEDGVREVFLGDVEVGEEGLNQVIDDVSVRDEWAIVSNGVLNQLELRTLMRK
ncbi:hypothetical protein TorRG33x02_182240 [Trema orientale]|uniref:Uncharacterized protein n=1 Tax=Trema orientale TaxID=63057 RepID=A0A2P5EKG7_TREOI|nr:hypothetical protein TorRG33x02_182240 [Trema orientale]